VTRARPAVVEGSLPGTYVRAVKTTIRAAALRDSPELADLTTQLGYPVEADAMRRRLERLLGRSDDVVLVAVDGDDRAIGWIHVAMPALLEHGDYASINGLVVDERWRDGGIGRALVAAGEEWARQHGATEITVRSRSTRERAHRFYAQNGYDEIKLSHVFGKPLV
jgi:GNAT superfamily N-acetyltransferase